MRSKSLLGCFVFFLAIAIIGCGHVPQFSSSNRKILEGLQSAVSSKKLEWIDAVVLQVTEKRNKKEMSDAEFAAIDAIVQKAKAGDWTRAQKDSFALSDGQKPTAEDLAMVKNRKSAQDVRN